MPNIILTTTDVVGEDTSVILILLKKKINSRPVYNDYWELYMLHHHMKCMYQNAIVGPELKSLLHTFQCFCLFF